MATKELHESAKKWLHTEEVMSYFYSKNNAQILAHMGLLNRLIGSALLHRKAIKSAKNRGCVTASLMPLKRCVVDTFTEPVRVRVATTTNNGKGGLLRYIQNHWIGACASKKTLLKYQQALATLGVYERAESHWIPGRFGDGRANRQLPPEYIIDMPRALVLYEYLESILKQRAIADGYEENPLVYLPRHKGMLIKRLYDVLFRGVAAYGREKFLNLNPEIREVPAIAVKRQQIWNEKIKAECPKSWEELINSLKPEKLCDILI